MRRYCKKLRETLFWLTFDSFKTIEVRANILFETLKRHQISKNPILERIELRFGILPCEYVDLKELLKIGQNEYKPKPNKLRLVARATKNNRAH